MRSRKGLFFTIDVVLAILVMVIGLVVIFSAYLDTPTYIQPRSLSSTLMNFLASTEVDELNIPGMLQYAYDGTIENPQDTILIALGKLYAKGGQEEAMRSIVANVTYENGLVIAPYNFAVFIDKDTNHEGPIYNSSDWREIRETDTVVTSKRIIAGLNSSQRIWGPFVAEVWVW